MLYNLLYLAMFVVLGVVSVLVFQPVTTIPALLQSNEPPRELIARAFPMTGLFGLGTAASLFLFYRPSWTAGFAILLTTSVLILFLGLNISVLGLVAVPRGALGVIGEVFALLVAIIGIYAWAVWSLGRSLFDVRSPLG